MDLPKEGLEPPRHVTMTLQHIEDLAKPDPELSRQSFRLKPLALYKPRLEDGKSDNTCVKITLSMF